MPSPDHSDEILRVWPSRTADKRWWSPLYGDIDTPAGWDSREPGDPFITRQIKPMGPYWVALRSTLSSPCPTSGPQDLCGRIAQDGPGLTRPSYEDECITLNSVAPRPFNAEAAGCFSDGKGPCVPILRQAESQMILSVEHPGVTSYGRKEDQGTDGNHTSVVALGSTNDIAGFTSNTQLFPVQQPTLNRGGPGPAPFLPPRHLVASI